MKAVLTLAKLDISRHRFWRFELKSASALITVSIYVSLVLLGLFVMSRNPMFSILFPLATFVVAGATLGISFIGIHMTANPGEREWWLVYPHPRRTLIMAKFLSHLFLGIRSFVMTSLAALTVAMLAHLLFGAIPDANLAWPYAFASALLALVCIPVFAAIGTSFILFTTGFARVGNVLFGLIFGAIGGVTGAGLGGHMHHLVTPSLLFQIAGWVSLGGGVAGAILLWLSPIGVRRLGNAHIRATGSSMASTEVDYAQSGRGNRQWAWQVPVMRKRSLSALFRYELTRYRWLSRRAPLVVRISALILSVVLVAIGIFLPASREAFVSGPVILLLFCSMCGPIVMMTVTNWDFAKGFALWWMTFPLPRARLLWVRVLSVFGVAFSVSAGGLLCMGVGMAIHGIFQPIPATWWTVAWPFWWRVLLVMYILSPTLMFMMQGTSALYRGPRAILLVPMYVIAFNGTNVFITRWIMSDDILQGPIPGFGIHFGITMLVLVPLSIAAVIAGARTLPNLTYAKAFNRFK